MLSFESTGATVATCVGDAGAAVAACVGDAGAVVATCVGDAPPLSLWTPASSEQAAAAKSSAMVNTADFHKPDTHLLVCSLIVVLRSFRLSMSMAAVDTPAHGSYTDTEYQYMTNSFLVFTL